MWSKDEILIIYQKYNIKASKRFGQNFLIDQNVLKIIREIANIKNKEIIEIGPGLGSLTKYLLESAKSVIAYEIDDNMVKVLKNEIKDEKFTLINDDFLKANLDFNNKKTVVANIPYNITSDIIFKFFENSDKIDRAIIMVQKEVAERITSKAGSKNYGKLSVVAQHFADVKYNFTVSRQSFFPAPKVDSAVITFDFKNIDYNESIKFLKFVKQCFAMRRKTLFNNLKNFLGANKAKELIISLDKKETIRPQELSYNDFIKLFNNVK
ncbi:MAG: 16S rRNA (adenine(1518)-N(6)/adenine(1519)-N(6))-dimethyltransferase RsmA [Mycoplasmatales bacterium]|nr:16S rRNA (adenine(1518)-N(6)/adenine(1519)-N(6))-dimethyltransferase RsmA [Mycoplasmatales bacterium]